MKIEYSPKFRRCFKKLPAGIKQEMEAKTCIFRNDPFDLKLKTHKLSGPLRNYWAFWIDYRYRVIFSFMDAATARFHVIGDHSIYQ